MKSWKNLFNPTRGPKQVKPSWLFFLPFVFATLILPSPAAFAQVEDSKTLTAIYDSEQIVRLRHAHGNMEVKKSPDDKVYIETVITAEAKSAENLANFLAQFQIQGNAKGNALEVLTVSQISSWSTKNNVSTITFKNGRKVKGIKKATLTASLLVPDVEELQLSNKYGDIELATTVSNKLTVELFSGNLITSNDIQHLDLTLKYGKSTLVNVNSAKVTLFDSDINMGNLTDGTFNSKYSKVKINNIETSLTSTTFDDKWEIGQIKGPFKFHDKYSEFYIGEFTQMEGTIFDGKVEASIGQSLKLNDSKYSSYRIKELKDLSGHIIFDDDFRIDQIEQVNITNSKYTSFEVGILKYTCNLAQSFDDHIELKQVAASMQNIFLNGKYTKMALNIEEGAQFMVEVNTQYGHFNHPDFDIRVRKENHNKLELSGFVGPEMDNTDKKLTIKGFDNTVNWQ